MPKRFLINGFIAAFLALILIDGLPATSLFHERLKAFVDPILDKTGLWQQSWQLFAPSVDKINARLSATFTYADGSTREWQSPVFAEQSLLKRFLSHRHAEYTDAVRNDANASAWPALVRYIAQQEGDQEPTHVTLTRHWNETPPPRLGDRQPHVSPRPMTGSYVLLESSWSDLKP